MKKFTIIAIGILLIIVTGCSGLAPKPPAYWPTSEWRSSTPEEQGMDSEVLAGMFQQIEDDQLNLHSLLIVRNGYIVTEAYFAPYTQDRVHNIASVTKSVISSLVGIAIQRGEIKNVDQTLVSFFPDKNIANLDELKKSITLKNLLSLTAGLECNDSPFSGGVSMEQSSDWVQFMLDAPMAEQPGTKFNYCGGAVHLLSAIIQKTTGMSSREYANKYLFEPLGIPAVADNRWQSDPQGVTIGPYGLLLTPRDMAKIGYLYLQNGKWDGQQLLDKNWVKAASTSYITKDNGFGYGYLWTVDPAQESFSALGLAGQEIYVIPSKSLVVVFTAVLPSTQPDADFLPLKALVDKYILPSIKSDKTLAENPAAVSKLNELITSANNPPHVEPTIPSEALQWSGVEYKLNPNPNQWDTISFSFTQEADTITININGADVDPLVGLDNQFRIQTVPEGVSPLAFRGYWIDSSNLYIEYRTLGEFGDINFRVSFSDVILTIRGATIIDNQKVMFQGSRVND